MKAVVYHRYGGPEVLELADVAPPKMHVDSVLVRVYAAAVNPADLAMRAGHGDATVPTYFPVIQPTDASLEVDFGDRWPWAGKLSQRVSLTPGRLDVELIATAIESMPITMGLHPWFRRRLERGGDVQFDVPAESQYEKDATGLPSGHLIAPRAGPWDDCFVCQRPVVLRWPGALELSISSSHDHFVVFDERPAAVCVEPQTGPPNAFDLELAHHLGASESLRLAVSLTWTTDSAGAAT